MEDFFSLCREGLFVFESACAVGFVKTLPKEVAACVQSVVITSAVLYADDYSDRIVWPKTVEPFTPFTSALKDNLPSLREISVFLPPDVSDFYCAYAPTEICKLLLDGTIDVVRVMCNECVADDWSLDKHYVMEEFIKGDAPLCDFKKDIAVWKKETTD